MRQTSAFLCPHHGISEVLCLNSLQIQREHSQSVNNKTAWNESRRSRGLASVYFHLGNINWVNLEAYDIVPTQTGYSFILNINVTTAV